MSKSSMEIASPKGGRKQATSSTVTVREAREQWADVLNRVMYRGERFTITRRGKVIAELVPATAA